jgi:hypothetical protein
MNSLNKKIYFIDDIEVRTEDIKNRLGNEFKDVFVLSNQFKDEFISDMIFLIIHFSYSENENNSEIERITNLITSSGIPVAKFSGGKEDNIINDTEIILSRFTVYQNITPFIKYYKYKTLPQGLPLNHRVLLYGDNFLKAEELFHRELLLLNKIEKGFLSDQILNEDIKELKGKYDLNLDDASNFEIINRISNYKNNE